MFEGAPDNLEGMIFHYVIECLFSLFLHTHGNGLVVGFNGKNELGVYPFFPHLNLVANFVSESCGISFMGY